jgi:photosystem II stability/assembly factor-like uncharacterized protein
VYWVLLLAAQTTLIADSRPDPSVPTAVQRDANLHDIHFVGARYGWAVGDHGTIWHSSDGGQSWHFQQSGVDCTLNSVCFLTNTTGWAVGGGTQPYTHMGFGVVLHTSDGGQTWSRTSAADLPRLHSVTFFGPAKGIAVGDRGSRFPTGLLQTSDAGRTWSPVAGDMAGGWRAAHFSQEGVGVVVGLRGRLAVVGGGRLLQPQFERPSLRTFRDLAFENNESGWAVGDGGLLLTTDSGGVTWRSPATALPRSVADIFDCRAVAVANQHVWIGGSPGSVVWSSADQGQTWKRLTTGQTTPINDLEFVSTNEGWAAGSLGMILHTQDAGRSWQPVLGGSRRAALLVITSRPERLSLHLIAQQSADLGYRSLVWLPADGDLASGHSNRSDLDLRLQDAVLSAAGCAAEIDWRFPVDVPGIEHIRDRLLANWNERHEGRLTEVIVGNMAAKLRTWRPNVVVIDQPATDDAVGQVLKQAVMQAIQLAADPAAFPEQIRLAGLHPWQTARILERLPAGDRGHEQIDPARFLPRLKSSLHVAAAPAYARLVTNVPDGLEAYAALAQQPVEVESAAGFFAGLSIAPGSDARRRLATYDEGRFDRQRRLARQQRDLRAIARKISTNEPTASQLVAHLTQFTRGLPDNEAAQRLAELAAQQRRAAHWHVAEAISLELVNRFPERPEALASKHWLFHLWSSAEANWQRAKQQRIDQQRVVAVSASPKAVTAENVTQAAAATETPLRSAWRRDLVSGWQLRAARIAETMRRQSGALYDSPEYQFSLAALSRQSGNHRRADDIYRSFLTGPKSDYWKQAAEQELWLIRPTGFAPAGHSICTPAAQPPQLDGSLSEACWQRAQPITLQASKQDALLGQPQPLAMLCYDNRYLYIGLSVPRVAGTSTAAPELSGRTHDADLTLYDRVAIDLDVDRDRSICYEIHIDQRGWTSESAWGESAWNPRYWVAASSDTKRWRIEAAIPFSELVSQPPTARSIWCVGLRRIAPGFGMQSYPTARPEPPRRFGLLEFR